MMDKKGEMILHVFPACNVILWVLDFLKQYYIMLLLKMSEFKSR